MQGLKREAKFEKSTNQNKIAKECAEWLEEKVEVKSMKHSAPMSMININNPRHYSVNLFGSTNFTSSYLGFTYSTVSSAAHYTNDSIATEQYMNLFNSSWSDLLHLEDVKKAC